MNRVYDCFLYNHEVKLLEIRLELLEDIIDYFVLVWAKETFTGKPKSQEFCWANDVLGKYKSKVNVIAIDKLEGNGPWEKEAYPRNRINDGLHGASASDLVMISDIDEVPRPSVLHESIETAMYDMHIY